MQFMKTTVERIAAAQDMTELAVEIEKAVVSRDHRFNGMTDERFRELCEVGAKRFDALADLQKFGDICCDSLERLFCITHYGDF